MPGVASTSGRLHCELLRLLFLQAHLETEKYCRLFGVPAKTNQDSAGCKGLFIHSFSPALAASTKCGRIMLQVEYPILVFSCALHQGSIV